MLDYEYVDLRDRAAERYIRELIRDEEIDEDIIMSLINFCGVNAIHKSMSMRSSMSIVSDSSDMTISFTFSKSDVKDAVNKYKSVK